MPSPRPLGTAASGALVASADNALKRDDYGILSGTIRYQIGDHSDAQRLRPIEGLAYTGGLPHFQGTLVDTAGDIIGAEGRVCYLDVTYAMPDPRFKLVPETSADVAYMDAGLPEDAAFTAVPFIPVPNPVLTYKFADTKRQGKQSKFDDKPPGAPPVPNFVWETIWVGVRVRATMGPIAAGWLCMEDAAAPLCAGKFFRIRQTWKRFYSLTSIKFN